MYAIIESGSIRETWDTKKSFELNGLKYAKNVWDLWSTSDLNTVGCFIVVEDNTNFKDSAFYTNTNPIYTYNADAGTVTRTYGTATAQDLNTIKTREKSVIKEDARNLLQHSDWEVIKAKELDESVASATTTYRASVRTKANAMETAITNASDVDALAALYIYTDGIRPLGELPRE